MGSWRTFTDLPSAFPHRFLAQALSLTRRSFGQLFCAFIENLTITGASTQGAPDRRFGSSFGYFEKSRVCMENAQGKSDLSSECRCLSGFRQSPNSRWRRSPRLASRLSQKAKCSHSAISRRLVRASLAKNAGSPHSASC